MVIYIVNKYNNVQCSGIASWIAYCWSPTPSSQQVLDLQQSVTSLNTWNLVTQPIIWLWHNLISWPCYLYLEVKATQNI